MTQLPQRPSRRLDVLITIFGLIIMVIVLFLPGGIIGTLRERLPRLRRILE